MSSDENVQPPPFEQDDCLNHNLYETARKVDKILHREPIENHAAIVGIIQVTTQRRISEHNARKQAEDAAQRAADARRQQFAVQ